MKKTYVYRNGRLVEKVFDGPNPKKSTSHFFNQFLFKKPFRSPIDDREITSFRDLERHNRELGVEDVGSESDREYMKKLKPPPPKRNKDAVRKAVEIETQKHNHR